MGRPECTYSADDLLRAAAAQGIPRTHAWIRTLVNDGLLDRPDNHGIQGRRGGRVNGSWSETQFRLYRKELKLIHQGSGRAELCQLPVRLWLQLGPDRVPVRQVRRALRTYSRYAASKRQARTTARQLAKLYSGDERPSRRERVDLIDASAPYDRDKFREAARRLIDPENAGRTLGPPDAQISPGTHARVIDAYLAGVEQLDFADDRAFARVRQRLLEFTHDYAELQPKLLHDREVGAAFATITPRDVQKQPCALVLMSLAELPRSDNETRPDPRPKPRPR